METGRSGTAHGPAHDAAVSLGETDASFPHKTEPRVASPLITGNTWDADVGELEPFPELDPDTLLPIADGMTSGWNGASVSNVSLEASQVSLATSEEHQIQAFAKLEFDDGEFYMNTYAVELGRDIRAARSAYESDVHDSRPARRSASSAPGSVISGYGPEDGGNAANGVLSESGGVIGVDSPTAGIRRRSRRKKSRSIGSSSRRLSRKSSLQLSHKTNYNALAMESLMDYASTFDGGMPDNYMPTPETIPLIPIHPPTMAQGGSAGHKSISRKHIKIAFNFEKHFFEVEILGRNGGFVDEEYYAKGEIQPLVNGSVIQIGGVGIRFVLPDVPLGETGAENQEELNPLPGELAFDMADSNEEIVDNDDDDDDDDDDDEDDNEVEDQEAKQVSSDDEEVEALAVRAKVKPKEEPEPPKPKRKGPGRPPKNGIISKREQALLARQAREEAKEAAQKKLGKSAPGKGKTAKVVESKESSTQPTGKRKYTKRKRAGGTEARDQRVRESTEQTDSVPPEHAVAQPAKPPKEKRPPKPPRSPSPVYDESKMTPEQLAKPQASYVVLIHEALSNSKTGPMSLPQIYRAIERRYPYFKLRVTTLGWQSSVRHNLSQHNAFEKIERDGKGWMWGLKPEVSIEKEKKRRATPPPAPQNQHHPQPYYSRVPKMMQHAYPYPTMPPPNGHMPPMGYPMYPTHIPHPPLGPAALPLPLANAQSESTYQSPYGSTPPTTTPQPTSQTRPAQENVTNTNGHYPNPTSLNPQTSKPPIPEQSYTAAPTPLPAPNGTAPSAPPMQTNPTFHSPDVMTAVAKFKTALIDDMSDKARAETLVTSAINRTLGVHPASGSGEDDPQVKTIMVALSGMLDDLKRKRQGGGKEGGGGGANEKGVAELAAEVVRRLPGMNGGGVKRRIDAVAGAGGGEGEAGEPERKKVAV